MPTVIEPRKTTQSASSMNLHKTTIPENSVLYADRANYHYSDSYEVQIKDATNRLTLIGAANTFMKPSPKWINFLLKLRNLLVALVGLKTTEDVETKTNYQFEPNERAGLFRVFSKTEHELILGEDDKHLNFRVSLYLETVPNDTCTKQITVTTIVIYNNWFGRFYFFFVKPFHQLIVQTSLKTNFQTLELDLQNQP